MLDSVYMQCIRILAAEEFVIITSDDKTLAIGMKALSYQTNQV